MRLKDSEARPFGSNSQWGEEAGDGTKVVTQFQGLCLWPYGVVSRYCASNLHFSTPPVLQAGPRDALEIGTLVRKDSYACWTVATSEAHFPRTLCLHSQEATGG